ncbi:uncharacterized protein LOC128993529 [Macrosteles quadrilineatus]|uniref:uncharacterized protein LOC128993529 n=1 Tax=Macrosteles quadrilineatus TaxID=74068 RepID=UPI0023E186D2|nr:uncharacterized protein LOC128993529 [Macrosteles quadrilineatus]XP_054273472.1 uncharacterized protein LOC128993529 [Macrosteles quadrilineatus]
MYSSTQLVVSVIILTALTSGGNCQTANKCKLEFLKKINDNVWKQIGIPTDILKTASEAGKEYIVRTTEGYYPADVKCAYTVFGDEGKTVQLITISGTKSSHPEKDPLEEHDGVVEEEDTHIKRVHIYSKEGVVVWYKCLDEGDDGPIEVAMKVKENSFDPDKVTQVKALILNELGVDLKQDYNHDCAVDGGNGNL